MTHGTADQQRAALRVVAELLRTLPSDSDPAPDEYGRGKRDLGAALRRWIEEEMSGADTTGWAEWLATVDRNMRQRGLTQETSDDWPWRDAFEAGQSPEAAVNSMLEETMRDYGLGR